MQNLLHHWRNVPRVVRKPLVLVAGLIIVAAGVGLLVLPGPGWVVIFLGFAILASEFKQAEKIQDWFVALLKKIVATCRKFAQKIRK